jgi:hypothetical protein
VVCHFQATLQIDKAENQIKHLNSLKLFEQKRVSHHASNKQQARTEHHAMPKTKEEHCEWPKV